MLTWVKNNQFTSRILIVKLLLAFCVFTLYPLEVEAGRVRVRGYYRKDGTYVRPHYRTAPDGNPYNNYSFPGNYNPNTGRITPGNPQKYLDRYYNRSSSSYSTPSIDFDKWLKDWEADIDKQLRDLRSGSQNSGDVNVRGYFRRDGTYVAPHVRTAPDEDPTNNYSYLGNYNPNTGKITSGDPFKFPWEGGAHNSASSTNRNLNGLSFTVGSTMEDVIASQGTPDSFSETHFSYGLSRVYFRNGKVSSWNIYSTSPLRAKYPTTYTSKTYFTLGSTKGEVAAIQGTPNSFSETHFSYGLSRVYFRNGKVSSWNIYSTSPLRAKYPTTYTSKTYFTLGSTKGEVAAIQGTPNSFSETHFSYGLSRVYFRNGKVSSWNIYSTSPLRAKYPTTYTSKTYFTLGSTKGEVAAIQGTPNSFSETHFSYGLSRVYFRNGKVSSWNIYSTSPLRAKYPTTYTNKTYFTLGSTKGEVAAIQGTPNSFSETHFSYGLSRVYFRNGKVSSWNIYSTSPLKVR